MTCGRMPAGRGKSDGILLFACWPARYGGSTWYPTIQGIVSTCTPLSTCTVQVVPYYPIVPYNPLVPYYQELDRNFPDWDCFTTVHTVPVRLNQILEFDIKP
jgi:hypothetical protein